MTTFDIMQMSLSSQNVYRCPRSRHNMLQCASVFYLFRMVTCVRAAVVSRVWTAKRTSTIASVFRLIACTELALTALTNSSVHAIRDMKEHSANRSVGHSFIHSSTLYQSAHSQFSCNHSFLTFHSLNSSSVILVI